MDHTQSTVASGNYHLSAQPGEERSVARRATAIPTSQEAGQNEISLVKAEILDIQGQLARRRANEDESDPVYRHWKGNAIAALRAKEARHTFLKRWLHHEALVPAEKTRNRWLRGTLADIVTALEGGEDAQPALKRLIAWRDEWLDSPADL